MEKPFYVFNYSVSLAIHFPLQRSVVLCSKPSLWKPGGENSGIELRGNASAFTRHFQMTCSIWVFRQDDQLQIDAICWIFSKVLQRIVTLVLGGPDLVMPK